MNKKTCLVLFGSNHTIYPLSRIKYIPSYQTHMLYVAKYEGREQQFISSFESVFKFRQEY